MFIDTHAHLNDPRLLENVEDILERAKRAGVEKIVNVGYDVESSKIAVELAEKYPMLYAAVGMHPHEAKDYTDKAENKFLNLTKCEKVVAYGEIGLDYHYDNSPREVQKEIFKRQMELAREQLLPIIIHNRESWGDMLEILKSEDLQNRGIMHCFSGSNELAEETLKLGLYISFAGPITFKNASKILKAVEHVPLERLLIETDCPYLAPVPFRGKTNEPSYVSYVCEKIAEIKGISLEEAARATTNNAQNIFKL